MMDLRKARGESWTAITGEEKYLPLFKESELPKVNSIVESLDGMDLESSFELLEKVKKCLLQAAQVSSR